MTSERLEEIRLIVEVGIGIPGSLVDTELREALAEIDLLQTHLRQSIVIAEQRGYRLEEEGEALGDPEEAQLEVSRSVLSGKWS